MAPELVIFDCDGVLVDSEALAARVLAEALVDLGLDYTIEQTDAAFRGRSLADVIKAIEEELGGPIPGDFLSNLERDTRDAFETSLKPVPGIRQLLDELTERGIDLCVASSGTPEKIRHSLEFTDLAGYFEDRLFSASQVARGKPAPDLFVFAAVQMGHSIGKSVIVEDSLPGAQGAVASGAQVIGYAAESLADRENHAAALRNCGAKVIARMSEAVAILGLEGSELL